MYKERLKFLRERQGVTQKTLSTYLDINTSHYSHLENEDEMMPIKYLNLICNYFNVSLDYIFNLTDDAKYKREIKEIDSIESGKRLKEFRKNNNLTQAKLASILNVGQSTIAEYERGTNIIATPFLYELCKKYHISADYILGKTKKS